MQYWADFGVENNLLSSQTCLLNATTYGATSDNGPLALLKLKYLITAKRTLFATGGQVQKCCTRTWICLSFGDKKRVSS